MSDSERPRDRGADELELLRRHDGAERVSRLPWARVVTIAPAADSEAPATVEIVWPGGVVEHPPPGSSLWRAVLERYLAEPETGEPGQALLKAQVRRSLERYPDLETWWRWLRTGWTAPPRIHPSRRG